MIAAARAAVGHRLRCCACAVVFSACGLFTPALAQAQPEPVSGFGMRTGVGWVGVIPDAFLGAGVFHVPEGWSWGLYAGAQMNHDSKTKDPVFLSHLNVTEVEAMFAAESFRRQPVRVWEDLLLLNVGIMRALTSQFGLGVGAGVARWRFIQEYADNVAPPDEPLTVTGFYLVEDDHRGGWEPNFSVTGVMRGGDRVGFSTGFESSPRAFTLGVLLLFP